MCATNKPREHMLPASAVPHPGRRQRGGRTNLLVGDGLVLERPGSPVGGPDDLAPEMLQLRHKAKATESGEGGRGGCSRPALGGQEKSVRRA